MRMLRGRSDSPITPTPAGLQSTENPQTEALDSFPALGFGQAVPGMLHFAGITQSAARWHLQRGRMWLLLVFALFGDQRSSADPPGCAWPEIPASLPMGDALRHRKGLCSGLG